MLEPGKRYGCFQLINISDWEETRLRSLVYRTLPKANIKCILEVKNSYLSQAYEIRRFQYKNQNSIELLHTTSVRNVELILKNNLDWRRVKRSRFGVGVSFTNDASYADKYSNRNNGKQRAFIICDVLIGRECLVDANDNQHPPPNINTYRSRNKKVWVKFDDFTFNPTFVIYYEYSEDAELNLTAQPSPIFRLQRTTHDNQFPLHYQPLSRDTTYTDSQMKQNIQLHSLRATVQLPPENKQLNLDHSISSRNVNNYTQRKCLEQSPIDFRHNTPSRRNDNSFCCLL